MEVPMSDLADSDSVNLGSNPSSPATENQLFREDWAAWEATSVPPIARKTRQPRKHGRTKPGTRVFASVPGVDPFLPGGLVAIDGRNYPLSFSLYGQVSSYH